MKTGMFKKLMLWCVESMLRSRRRSLGGWDAVDGSSRLLCIAGFF